MARGHDIDGKLADWSSVRAIGGWDTLLLGNGLSINIWPKFNYSSLYEQAERRTKYGGLSDEDKKLFKGLRTTNFEVVLADLNAAIRIAELLGENPDPFYERYRSVQAALGAAIRGVHISRDETPDPALHQIQKTLKRYDAVFTTSYDLMIYWGMGYGDDFDHLCDCFWANGRNEFDPLSADVWPDWTPIYYLHGALHLIVQGDGITRKLTRSDKTLLDQFGQPIPGDAQARPLLISEGSTRDKLLAIDGNTYLSAALKRLRERERPMVVFGHALGDQDQHLVDAINANPDRAVAVSLRKDSEKKVRAAQGLIRGKLDTPELYFYDASTHPLGSPRMTKKTGMFSRPPLGRLRVKA